MPRPPKPPQQAGMHLHFWQPWGNDVDSEGKATTAVVRAKCVPADHYFCNECHSKPCQCARKFSALDWNRGRVKEL